MAYRDYMPSIAPPWLNQEQGQKFWAAVGKEMDAVVDEVLQATKARMPDHAPDADALNRIGEDRLLPRGPLDSPEGYAARLKAAWTVWGGDNRPVIGEGGGAGTHLGILRALAVLGLPIGPMGITLVNQAGVWSQLDLAGDLVRGRLSLCWNRIDLQGVVNVRPGWTFDGRDNFFSLFGLVIPQDMPDLTVDSNLHHAINAECKRWKQGCAQFVGTWIVVVEPASGPDGGTFGWPTGQVYGDGSDWGGDDVRFLEPDGGNRIGYYPP